MADYSFDLRGRQSNFEGIGCKDGEAYKSQEFTLTQGIVVAEIVHHGSGDFKLKFVPTEGLSEGQATGLQVEVRLTRWQLRCWCGHRQHFPRSRNNCRRPFECRRWIARGQRNQGSGWSYNMVPGRT